MSKRKTRSSASAAAPTKLEKLQSNPYLEQIRLKREKNKKKLDDLGIGDNFTVKERRRKLSQIRKQRRIDAGSASPNTPASPDLSAPIRRSARQMRKPVQYTAIDAIEDAQRLLASKIAKRKHISTPVNQKLVKRRKFKDFDQIPPIDDAALRKLASILSDDWLEDMQQYFAEHQGNSANNVQRVMTVVRKLVSGVGIQHPATRERFNKNEKIHLGCNFRGMLDDASEWVYSNGGDRGNGWLIEHPVKKCLVYQMARIERGKAFFSNAKP